VTTTPPPNPFEAFKAAYDQAAESWSKSMEQVLSSEDFAAAAGRMVARYADAQEALRQAAEATSNQLHLPSKDDLAQVSQLVLNLERKIDDASDQILGLAKSCAALPSAEVFTQISDRLASLETAFQRFVSTPAPAAKAAPAAAPAAVPTAKAAARTPRPRRAASKE
jgi:polyhydroxyalkanoic acid synthase PhaR subunit